MLPSPHQYVFVVQVTRQLVVDILNEYSSKGCHVILITGEVSNITVPLNHNVKVIYFRKYERETMFKRLISWVVFSLQTFFRILFYSKHYQLVFISTPPITAFAGLIFRVARSQKYHLIQWDLYPEALLALRENRFRNLIIRCWHQCNRALYRRAETIITLGESMAQAIHQRHHINTPIHIVHNWADTEKISPIDKIANPFATKYAQQEKLTVMYSGNMGQTHQLEVLIQAAKSLLAFTDINFIFSGEGVKKKLLETMVSELQLPNVIILPYQAPDVFPYAIAAADISVVTLDRGMDQVSVPSKTYSALAAGCAILAIGGGDSELKRIVEHYHCGRFCKYEDADCISDFIKELYQNRKLLSELKSNARRASADYTPENAKLYYQHLCNSN